jgi:tRNA ligase
MAIVVRLIDQENKWYCVSRVAHVTLGTRDSSVKPKESNDMLAKWLESGTGGDSDIKEMVLHERPILQGIIKAVPSR